MKPTSIIPTSQDSRMYWRLMEHNGLAYWFVVMAILVPIVAILQQRRALIMIIRHGAEIDIVFTSWTSFGCLAEAHKMEMDKFWWRTYTQAWSSVGASNPRSDQGLSPADLLCSWLRQAQGLLLRLRKSIKPAKHFLTSKSLFLWDSDLYRIITWFPPNLESWRRYHACEPERRGSQIMNGLQYLNTLPA